MPAHQFALGHWIKKKKKKKVFLKQYHKHFFSLCGRTVPKKLTFLLLVSVV